MFLAFDEELTKSITDHSAEIIAYYLNTRKKKCHCPFHDDKSPSFSITNKGFKCYGCGLYGDAIEFVSQYFSLGFNDAVKKITEDQTYVNNTAMVSGSNKRVASRQRTESICEIRYRSKAWTALAIDYWAQFGISLPTLKRNKVIPASEVWLPGDKGFYLYYDYKKSNPAFLYDFGHGYYKVYMPWSKKSKFITNCSYDMWQGAINLQYDYLIITSSFKDKMLLEEYGYNAIAPQSENTRPDLDTVRESFDQILVFFDNGDNEIEFGQSLAQALNCQYTYINQYLETKDPSDFYYYFGPDDTRDLFHHLIDKKLEL